MTSANSILDPRALMTFRAVAMHGSFAAAARESGWTQPALSQQVTRLEEQAGTVLVTRTVKGVELTAAGKRLLRHAELIEGHLARASRELAGQIGGPRTVRVFAFPSACTSIVAPVMSELIAETGDATSINVELEQREPSQVPDALVSGSADVAIVFRYSDEELGDLEDDFLVVPIGWDPLRLIVPKSGDADTDARRRLASYSGERWVAGCPSCRQHFLSIAHREGFTPDIRHSTDDYMVVQELVARDMSVSVVPRLSLESYRHPSILAHSLEEGDGRQLMLVMAKDEARPEVHRVAESLRRAATRVLDAPK